MTEPFDLCGPLPNGTLLLEASAGTGKTYTIAALATRYLAEGSCTLDQLLLVTYTRAATRELRERVRDRLRTTARALRRGDHPEDPVTALLAEGDAVDVARRAERLETALTTFDAATIVTTHAFCQQVLGELGIAADVDPLETFAEDLAELIEEVTTDLYLRDYGAFGAPPAPFTLPDAREIARMVVADAQAALDVAPGPAEPVDRAQESESEARQRFGEEVRAEVLRRRRVRRTITYDDLITRVAAAVDDPTTGAAVRDMMYQRYRVVMIDEFQDTDPAQWQILLRVFHERSTLVLIGDPKQAIYAFRGGDVITYLAARTVAHPIATLDDNHRTDAPLVRAVTDLFAGIALGHEAIAVRPGGAVHDEPRLHDAGPPLRLRTVSNEGKVDHLRERIRRDVVRDIVTLLSGPATLTVTTDGTTVDRSVRAGDVAVIVWRNADADRIRDDLRAAGVNAVVTGTTDVFSTPAGDDWATLLRALEKPQRPALVRAAMCSSFFPFTGTDLAIDGDALTDQTARTLQDWALAFERGGIAAVLRRAEPEMTARMLQEPDGERRLTDIRHIGERLHSVDTSVGISGLIEWMGVHRPESEEVTEGSRRLDSDADAVQVLTVHSSKGLEFPIVYLPLAWSRHTGNRDKVLRLHDADGRRVLDIRGGHTPQVKIHRDRHEAEAADEALRQLYVAMTRASSQVILWWAYASHNTPASPLQRIVGARLDAATEPKASYPFKDLASIERALGVAAEPIDDSEARLASRRQADAGALRAAPFDRTIDISWQRTSYSRLTAAAHDAHLADPPGGESDESPPHPTGTATDDGSEASLWSALPVGKEFGVVVHRVYETIDPTTPELTAEVTERCAEALLEQPLAGLTPQTLAPAILPTLATPLDASGVTLADLGPGDRLTELEFEIPLAGGDRCSATVTLGRIADLLDRHLDSDDPLAGYAQAMRADGLSSRLTGFLTGSIDAVLRTPGPDGDPRFLVVDYKTNWVGGDLTAHRLPVAAYTADALSDTMIEAHYPLQALLYQVALHRFLRWRLPGYDSARHLGGIRYLFVRGMSPTAPPPAGVFVWEPPTALVSELSDVLGGLP